MTAFEYSEEQRAKIIECLSQLAIKTRRFVKVARKGDVLVLEDPENARLFAEGEEYTIITQS